MANGCGARAEYDAAIGYAQRWLALDGLQESARRLLMELYARSGDRGAALRQYEACVQVLDEELGVEPSEQTNNLAERIRTGELLPALLPTHIEDIPPAPGLSPFRGLHYFDVSDADLFFGREALTAELVGRLRRDRFLAVVGASGNGQVRAYETRSLVSTSGEQVSARHRTLLTDFNRDISFSHDGKRIAMASSDSTVRVWDLEKGSQALTLRGHVNPVYGVSYSPDGSKIASAGDDETARVWDAESGAFLFTLAGHTEAVFGIAFNPDGTRVATASLDGTAKVWDASTGEELFTLYGHQGFVLDLVFSPEGRRLFTASVDGTVRSYLLDTGELIALARSRVSRSLTAEECKTYRHRDECPSSAADQQPSTP